jgi:hypothetical protein
MAEVVAGVSFQAPADVNQSPVCQQLALPCIAQRRARNVGVTLSVAGVLLTEHLVGVAEVSLYSNPWSAYASSTSADCRSAGADVPQGCIDHRKNYPRSALAGLQVDKTVIHKRSSRLRVFGQTLWGPQWSDVGRRQTVFQPGVGLDDEISRRFIVHLQYDYRFASNGARNLSTGRFLVGIGVPLIRANVTDDLARGHNVRPHSS